MQTPKTQGLLRQAKPAWPQPNRANIDTKANNQITFVDDDLTKKEEEDFETLVVVEEEVWNIELNQNLKLLKLLAISW